MDFDGHGLQRVTRNGSINIQPDWDPTGTRVAYTGYAAGNPDAYVADLAKGRISRGAPGPASTRARPGTPRGALALTLSPSGDPDIFTIDPATGAKVSRLTRIAGIDVSPTWSPGRSQLAFVSERSGGAQIYVANADGSGARRVTFQEHEHRPRVVARREDIAFVGRDGVFDVFTVRLDDNRVTRITQSAGDNEIPRGPPMGITSPSPPPARARPTSG